MFGIIRQKEGKISREKAKEESYKLYLKKPIEELKNELVNLNELLIDTNLAIEAITDAIFTLNERHNLREGSVSLMGHNLTCFPSGHERHLPKEQNTPDVENESFLSNYE